MFSDCKSLIDVCVVIDGSDSIGDEEFQLLRDSVGNLIDRLSIGEDQGHMGIVVYSTTVAMEIPLMSNKAKLKRYAAKMPHPRDGTNTDRGIETMTKLFKQKWRENVPKVGIVVTDGISKNRTKTLRQARTLKRMGVKMFSVGVGLANFIDYDELNGVASNKEHVLMVDSFDELAKNIIKLVKLICPGKCMLRFMDQTNA